jgi:hypothetical protein
MRRSLVWSLLVVAGISIGACKAGSSTAPDGDVIVIDGTVRGTGVVLFYDIEGGFYAIRGDDGRIFDPISGMPTAFRRHGLAVEFEGEIRHVGTIHMVGEAIALTHIRAR